MAKISMAKVQPVTEHPLHGSLKIAWQSARGLINYRKTGETLKTALPAATFNSAILAYAAYALLTGVIALITVVETDYFAAFTFQTVSEISINKTAQAGAQLQQNSGFNPDLFASFSAYIFAFAIPFGFFISLIQEYAAYHLFRLTGNCGSFVSQYYLSSIVALSSAMASILLFLAPMPCIGTIAFVAYYAITLYLLFVVRSKAYATAHQVSFLHAFVITALVSIPVIILSFIASGAAAGFFHLPQAAVYNITGNATNIAGNVTR